MEISTHKVFFDASRQGSEAAVVISSAAMSVNAMQLLANNLNAAATAFIQQTDLGQLRIPIRWFNPYNEIQRCGHATFAAANYLIRQKMIVDHCSFISQANEVYSVIREKNDLALELDYIAVKELAEYESYASAFNQQIYQAWESQSLSGYALLRFDTGTSLNKLAVDFSVLSAITKRAVIAFQYKQDCVQFRYFAPQYGVNEDSATGSAVSVLASIIKKTHRTLANNILIQDSPAGALFRYQCLADRVLLMGNYQQLS